MIRAVLDTNVVVSGFVGFAAAERTPAQLLRLWQGQRFELVLSAAILDEVASTFAIPYFQARLTPEQINEAKRLLREEGTLTALTMPVRNVATHSEDDLVLATAVSAQVDYLVTGDKQLQRLELYQRVRIISPWQFLALLNQEEPDR